MNETKQRPELTSLISDFEKFSEAGVIGHYTNFEVFEIVGFENTAPPFNVCTIAIATDAFKHTKPDWLCERIRIPGLKGQNFGIRRSVIAKDGLLNALNRLENSSDWTPIDKPLRVGMLSPMQRRFVPANSFNQIALNRVTKNNFFNGSYLLELFDTTKQHVMPLLADAKVLALLSEAVSKVIPIDLASLSDRLGNVILQFPVEVIRTEFRLNRPFYSVEVSWHPKSAPRKLIAIGAVNHDQTQVAFGCVELTNGSADLCHDTELGLLYGYVWDVDNKLLLAATDGLAYMKSASVNLRPMMHEPRVFPTSFEGTSDQARVQLTGSPTISRIGEFEVEAVTDPIQSRIYEEERQELARQRTFVQYCSRGQKTTDDRTRALEDIRVLVSQYGVNGVWLWDPYLSAQDILDTLFWNKNAGSPMRALTLLKTDKTCEGGTKSSKVDLATNYVNQLATINSNLLGINIEYRSAHGPRGWDFHDRFLIFPASGTGRALAWSLGTSVNSLGRTHHILQQVDNALLVASAFEELWEAVSAPDNLIWKHP